jgi:hypothetical protein
VASAIDNPAVSLRGDPFPKSLFTFSSRWLIAIYQSLIEGDALLKVVGEAAESALATRERGLKLLIRVGVGESDHTVMCLARHATTGCTTDLMC